MLSLQSLKAFAAPLVLLVLGSESRHIDFPEGMMHMEERNVMERGVMFTPQLGEATLPMADYETNLQREYAFKLGIGNYEQQVAASIAAVAAGGQAAISGLWSGLVKDGNPYALYYLSNGKGDPLLARINERLLTSVSAVSSLETGVGGAASTVVGGLAHLNNEVVGVGRGAQVPVDTSGSDAGLAVLSMMGQVYSTSYIVPSLPTAAAESSTASILKSTATASMSISSTALVSKAAAVDQVEAPPASSSASVAGKATIVSSPSSKSTTMSKPSAATSSATSSAKPSTGPAVVSSESSVESTKPTTASSAIAAFTPSHMSTLSKASNSSSAKSSTSSARTASSAKASTTIPKSSSTTKSTTTIPSTTVHGTSSTTSTHSTSTSKVTSSTKATSATTK